MLHTTVFAICALVVPLVTGLLPVGQSTNEVISVEEPANLVVDQRPPPVPSLEEIDLAKLPLFAHPLPNTTDCPTFDIGASVEGLDLPPKRRRDESIHLSRRATVSSGFGTLTTIISTYPDGAPAARNFSLPYDAQGTGTFPGCSVRADILNYPVATSHTTPHWRTMDGIAIISGLTFQSMVMELLEYNKEEAFLIVLEQALTLNAQAKLALDAVVPTSFMVNRYAELAGHWSLTIAQFIDLPGFGCTIVRAGNIEPLIPLDPFTDAKVLGTAGLLITVLILDLLIYELRHRRALPQAQDITMIRILLYVMEDFFYDAHIAIRSAGGPAPRPDPQGVVNAINVFAQGKLNGGGRPADQFLSQRVMLAKLGSDPSCRAAGVNFHVTSKQ